MPARNPDWTWANVKHGGANVGRVYYSQSNQGEYQAFKGRAALNRGQARFDHRQRNYLAAQGGGIKKAWVSAKLRRRRPGAARAALANINVLNPGYAPPNRNKAHLSPDIFGGPSIPQNLSNELSGINKSGHKKIENRIDRLMKAVTAPGDTHPLRTRGGLVVRETFSQAGRPTGRTYMVSIKNHTNNTRTYHKFTFNPV